MLILFQTISFDAIVDLGSGTFQVGTLRRVGSGNPIEALLNTESKRFSPTIVGYDGEQFHVGEYGAAFFKRNPGPVFRYFTNNPVDPITNFANDPDAPELEDVQGYQAVLLITALMNHIVTNMIKRNDTSIDITLIHPPKWSLSHLTAFKQAVEQLPNTTLFMTVPTPAAVVVTHLASRMKDFDKDKKGQQFVVVDVGATMTEVSVVQAKFSQEQNDVEVYLIHNEDYDKGGDAISRCIAEKHVHSKVKGYSDKNFKLKKRIEDAVEKAKIVLSAQAFTKLTIEAANGPQDDVVMELKKEHVDQCVDEIFADDKIAHFQNIGFHIDPEFDQEDTFYLFYGGSSRIPRIQKIFEDFFGAQILRTVNMDEGAIYGGGLVTARHIVGFKVANRFNAFDNTRPHLYYENEERKISEKLYRLNPHVKHSFETDFPAYMNETFQLGNGSFSVNHINESYYWETDETGERKKKSSQLYNTANVDYTKIITNPDPFKTLKFVTYVDDEKKDEVFFTYACNLTIAKFDHQQILKKYEAKKKPGETNTGMQGIKIQKMPEIRRDADKYSQQIKDFQDLLMKHLNDEETRKKYDLRLTVNFSSDSTSMPNMTYAAMHVINKDKNAKKDSSFLSEFVFEPKCEFEHNPRFMVDEFMFREAFNVVWDSNDIQNKRKQYEDSFNMIETILINADEFLEKYPASDEISGNHLVYADEADFLRVAVDDARYFMKHSQYLPHCPCVECLEERIRDLDAVLKKVVELQENIAKHIELAQCRQDVEAKFQKATETMEAAMKAAAELQESERGKNYLKTMEVCEIIKALEIDKDDDKKDEKDKDKDKKDKKENEEEPKESEVDRLKKLKKHQGKLKGTKAVLENYWFEDLYYLHGLKNNISEDQTRDLNKFYTKAMMKKLRKTNNDCGFLNGSYSTMLKKMHNYTNLKNGTKKDYDEFRNTFQSEMSLRPETPCDKIKNKTKDLDKEAQELEKKVKDVRGELDRARLTKVVDQLYSQAVDYKRLMVLLEEIKVMVNSKNFADAAKKLGEELKLEITAQQMEKALVGGLGAKLEKADVDAVDRVFDDIKEFVKTQNKEAKDEL